MRSHRNPSAVPAGSRHRSNVRGIARRRPSWFATRNADLRSLLARGHGWPSCFSAAWRPRAAPARRTHRGVTVRLTGALISGEAIIFAGGCAWLALGMRLGWSGAIYAGALPFIPGEIIKVALILGVVQGAELAWKRA